MTQEADNPSVPGGAAEAGRDSPFPFPAPPATHHALLQRLLDAPGVGHREPDLSDDALLGDIDVAHVQDVIDGLHLLHLDHPGVPVGSRFLQEALTVRLGLCYNLGKKQHRKTRDTHEMSGNVAEMGVHQPQWLPLLWTPSSGRWLSPGLELS